MFAKEAVATATISAGPAPETAPDGSLHFDTRGRLLFVRENAQWLRLGQLVSLEAPDNYSQVRPDARMQGHPH